MPTNVLHGQVRKENKTLPQESWGGGFLYNFEYFLNKPCDPL